MTSGVRKTIPYWGPFHVTPDLTTFAFGPSAGSSPQPAVKIVAAIAANAIKRRGTDIPTYPNCPAKRLAREVRCNNNRQPRVSYKSALSRANSPGRNQNDTPESPILP